MCRHIIAPSLAVLGLLALPVSSFAAGPYGVSLTLSHKGKAFAAPSVVVDDGVPATIKASGQDGYVLTITVTSAGQNRLMVATKLDSAYGSIHPAMMVVAGQTASATVGDVAISVNAHQRGS
jgi:hypothetical protein